VTRSEFTDFAFRIFSIFFYFVYVFIFALLADYFFKNIYFLTIFFHCVFNPVKAIKSDNLPFSRLQNVGNSVWQPFCFSLLAGYELISC
jgi:hypothetical protein